MIKTKPTTVRSMAGWLAGSGEASLLGRSEQDWRASCPPQAAKSGHPVALLIYAHRKVAALAEGEGWDNEYPRDTWHMRRLGIGSQCATLQFGGISQHWLRDLAKRWTRWRLGTGLEAQTCYRGVRALTRFSGFLAAAGVASPGGISRDVLERYLAALAAEVAGRRAHRDYIGQVAMFLRDVRRHQWDGSLPASAMIFPEDYPRPGQRLPRALAGHVMAQVEDPANLERQENLSYRLITLILIRCGLRITDATAIPSGCVVRDADGAPYLKYYNRKMKREALVPVDEELEALIARQRERNRERWPDGTPVLFPRPNANIDGTRPIGSSTYRDGLYRWLEDCDIRDEYGESVRLTPHQWRHTLGTVLINRDVPQHVVQKILDHYVGDPCQVDHVVCRYRRAAAAGERLSSWPISAQVCSWSRARLTAAGSICWAWAMRLARACSPTALSPSQVRGAQGGEGIDRFGEDRGTVGVGAGCGQLAGLGEPQFLAGHEALSSSRASRPSKTFCRPSWPLPAASSRWRCRVGRNSMVVWKKVHDSQMDSK